ncbi:hypothetical protein VTO73DRAFT_10797 [Trametes versicolor]
MTEFATSSVGSSSMSIDSNTTREDVTAGGSWEGYEDGSMFDKEGHGEGVSVAEKGSNTRSTLSYIMAEWPVPARGESEFWEELDEDESFVRGRGCSVTDDETMVDTKLDTDCEVCTAAARPHARLNSDHVDDDARPTYKAAAG